MIILSQNKKILMNFDNLTQIYITKINKVIFIQNKIFFVLVFNL